MSSVQVPVPPFDSDTHIRSADMTLEQLSKVAELRAMLDNHHLYTAYRAWCTDSQLQRFLIARLWNTRPAYDLVISALTWRSTRIPTGGVESLCNWEESMKTESDTGKMYINGYDQYHRPVIVFDNSVQNTSNVDTQLVALAWNLDTACRMMDPTRTDKYVVFMNLEIFSMFNCPPMKATKETIFMLCSGFPERLGHCVAYKPPSIFRVVFNSLKPLIDPKTAAKLVFVTGDVSEGSLNDDKMKELIGPNWKKLCGAQQPVLKKGNSPGFHIDNYWPLVMTRAAVLKGRADSGQPTNDTFPAGVNCGENASSAVSAKGSARSSTDDDNDGADCFNENFEWQSNRSNCTSCNRRFGFVIRRHHCRRCGRCVCWNCSPFQLALSGTDRATTSSSSSSSNGLRKSSDLPKSASEIGRKVRVCRQCAAVLNSQKFSGSADDSENREHNADTPVMGCRSRSEEDFSAGDPHPTSCFNQDSQSTIDAASRVRVSDEGSGDARLTHPSSYDGSANRPFKDKIISSPTADVLLIFAAWFLYIFWVPVKNAPVRFLILVFLYIHMVGSLCNAMILLSYLRFRCSEIGGHCSKYRPYPPFCGHVY
jgi:hypothetical protein